MLSTSRKVVSILLVAGALSLGAYLVNSESTGDEKSSATGTVSFVPNEGQWADQVLFRAELGSGAAWFTRDGLVLDLEVKQDSDSPQSVAELIEPASSGSRASHRRVLSARWVGADRHAEVVPTGKLPTVTNVLKGSDPAAWRTGLPTYPRITYHNLYPGVDVSYYSRDGHLEYDLIIAPGADLKRVELAYEAASSLALSSDGALVIETPDGVVTERLPVAYQLHGDEQVKIEGHFVLRGERRVGFEFGDGYRPQLAAVIDPIFTYGSYFGGSGEDRAVDMVVDGMDRIYVTGYTTSLDFPVFSALDGTANGDRDVFIMRLRADGSAPQFSTYFGGSALDEADAITLDNAGNILIAGHTESSGDFPTTGVSGPFGGGFSDAFIAQFNADATVLQTCIFYGGSGEDFMRGIEVDSAGNIIVAGITDSPDLPLANPQDPVFSGTRDAFVAKLTFPTATLLFSTYLGGSGSDQAEGLDINPAGTFIAVTGGASSLDFPLVGAFDVAVSDTQPVINEGFITVFDAGGAIRMSSYLGGSRDDIPLDVNYHSTNLSGVVFLVCGLTNADDFPLANAYDSTFNGGVFPFFSDAFVSRVIVTPGGGGLVASTFLGGSDNDYATRVHRGARNGVHVIGQTSSSNFPTVDAFTVVNSGGVDGFYSLLLQNGSVLRTSTYLGGSADDFPRTLFVDAFANRYIAGYTQSNDFPVPNGWDLSRNDSAEVFVVRIAGDYDDDGVENQLDNCPDDANSGQEDGDGNGIGDVCQVDDTLMVFAFSPVDLVVTDPNGDSIGIGFNTIQNGSSYDTLTDHNGDLEPDDIVTIPTPLSGDYDVRIIKESTANPGDEFTLAIRINGNQLLEPEAYQNTAVEALGTTVPDTYSWTAATTLPGDANADGVTTSSDIIYLVNFVFKGGPPTPVPGHGDVNCNGTVTSSDIIELVNYVFKGGDPPCSQTGS